MKKIFTLSFLMLLSGCWIGPDFYAGMPGVQPIEPGKYKAVDTYAMTYDAEQRLVENEIGARVTIAYADDGDVIVTNFPSSGDGPSKARLVALDEGEGLYVVKVDPGEGAVALNTAVYGLLAVRPGGGYRLSVPPCNGTRRLRPGSPVIVSGLAFGLRCKFEDRASFETAMRAFAKDPVSWTEYRRVGN